MSAWSRQGETYLVDASVYIFRYYFALPPNWVSRAGYSTEAVYGFTNFLLDLLTRGPARIACAFDESLGNCFRNEIYPDYKCSRALPDEALAYQLAACREMAKALGIASFASERFEADDILASLTQVCAQQALAPVIVTRDKDLGQLLERGAATLWDFAADRHLDQAAIQAKFGVRPGQIADYLALVGDSIDDIPGVPGVGAKTAARLLAEFDGVEALIANAEQVASLKLRGAANIARKIVDHQEQIRMALQLAQLEYLVPLNVSTEDLAWQAPAQDYALALADELGIGGLAKKIRRTCMGQFEPEIL
ncbi:5'-3' exonuclease H3TH domain-containing protein [Microbulbifer bruguierae]|uniref:5'-3' exonuclease H3TH domain-containing protein n=1 Tax=Microbulbifer bruguierae TaxID=3029061 RepID=A0ABY8NEW3_9GAMM|nr:5'-3' exonuclease H3TH domain-containing protein [Microbulbifer bruguierae]WGL17466.1 5'-3' exonuclease H3TH domain-containing protein [Microbulbifer bruguierae]